MSTTSPRWSTSLRASLDFWLTGGRFTRRFERECADRFGLNHRALGEQRVIGQSGRLHCPDDSAAGRPTRAARGRGDHGRGRLPDDGQPDRAERAACRSSSTWISAPTPRAEDLEAGSRAAHTAIMIAHTLGNRTTATWPAIGRPARAVADRGQLRRGRLAYRRTSHVGTFGDIRDVSFYPAHHITMGEGGAVLTNDSALAEDRRVVPRLGPRLLVRARQGQHLRQALRLAARRSALGLRPQVHLLATSATT